MMAGRRGLISSVWSFVRKPFGGGKKTRAPPGQLVGEDDFGNKYYEIPPDRERGVRGKRRVHPPGGDVNVEYPPEVPIEWESWLRGRRPQPPTQNEIDLNYARMMRVQQKVQQVAETQKPDDKADEYKQSSGKFPVHEEFELVPGEKSKRESGDR